MAAVDNPIAAPQVPVDSDASGSSTPPHRRFSALELAAMPIGEARRALSAQECAWMQEHYSGGEMLKLVREALSEPDIARVYCRSLDGSTFHWEAFLKCGCCSSSGEIIGEDSKVYDCPACTDDDVFEFSTDYDGKILEEPA